MNRVPWVVSLRAKAGFVLSWGKQDQMTRIEAKNDLLERQRLELESHFNGSSRLAFRMLGIGLGSHLSLVLSKLQSIHLSL
jgi:hypothetical protein